MGHSEVSTIRADPNCLPDPPFRKGGHDAPAWPNPRHSLNRKPDTLTSVSGDISTPMVRAYSSFSSFPVKGALRHPSIKKKSREGRIVSDCGLQFAGRFVN